MAQSAIIFAVNGNKQTTDHLISEEFDVSKKLEYEFSSFVQDDGVITLPISKLTPITKVIAQSTGNLNIKLYTDTEVISSSISGMYYSCIDPYVALNISGLTIETNNTDIGVDGFISILKLV